MISTDIDILEKTQITDINVSEPWFVVFHNDNVTSMDFVIMLLIKVFEKSPHEAADLMIETHTRGQAVVAHFSSFDAAEEKVNVALVAASEFGYPLRITIEQ